MSVELDLREEANKIQVLIGRIPSRYRNKVHELVSLHRLALDTIDLVENSAASLKELENRSLELASIKTQCAKLLSDALTLPDAETLIKASDMLARLYQYLFDAIQELIGNRLTDGGTPDMPPADPPGGHRPEYNANAPGPWARIFGWLTIVVLLIIVGIVSYLVGRSHLGGTPGIETATTTLPVFVGGGSQSKNYTLSSANDYRQTIQFSAASGATHHLIVQLEAATSTEFIVRLSGNLAETLQSDPQGKDWRFALVNTGLYELVVEVADKQALEKRELEVAVKTDLFIPTCIMIVVWTQDIDQGIPVYTETRTDSKQLNVTGFRMRNGVTVAVNGFKQINSRTGWYRILYPGGNPDSQGRSTGWVYQDYLQRDDNRFPGCYFERL